MPSPMTQINTEYNQQSFAGGMNLLLDDTHLQPNQYRIGFNVRNRYDRLDLILASKVDVTVPNGKKQELVTFGNYEIVFVAGLAYYKYYTDNFWTQIKGFAMDFNADRYWTCAIPVATTNYLRIAGTGAVGTTANSRAAIQMNNVAGASAGNLPGLLVQDNINQPVFIFLDANGFPTVRTTQTYAQWKMIFDDSACINLTAGGDQREYVPVGNQMAYVDGILYVASQDTTLIYRSVSGRPLDFVVNVTNVLPALGTDPANPTKYVFTGGGDATTTAYSVGVGGISCLRGMADGSLFVAAGISNFSVSKNMSQNAPLEFGEYTFIRKLLFFANCLSDRAIIDSLGDTRFIDLTGVRSFNAISQTQNEGRNTPFTANIQGAFGSLIQDARFAASALFNDYEFYAVNTVFGPAILVYDTINTCWTSIDISQCGGKQVKMLKKIDLAVQVLYAVTEDDSLYQLYVGPGTDIATVRSIGICSNILYANSNVKLANPRMEIKPTAVRAIVNNITQNGNVSVTTYMNNRMSSEGTVSKNIIFEPSATPTTGPLALSDVDTMLSNLMFPQHCEQGWKTFIVFSWNVGSLTQFSLEANDLNPINPINSQ